MAAKTLHRSETNKLLGGVCGGLGEYLDIDPTIIRIVFVLITLFGGAGVLFYIILWIIVPSEISEAKSGKETVKKNVKEVEETAKELIKGGTSGNSRIIWGAFIVAIGLLFLFDSLFGIHFLRFDKLWPIIIIALGILVLIKNAKK